MLASQAVEGVSSKWKYGHRVYWNIWKSMSFYASDVCTIMSSFLYVSQHTIVITCTTAHVLFLSMYVKFTQYKVRSKPDQPNRPWGRNRMMNTPIPEVMNKTWFCLQLHMSCISLLNTIRRDWKIRTLMCTWYINLYWNFTNSTTVSTLQCYTLIHTLMYEIS